MFSEIDFPAAEGNRLRLGFSAPEAVLTAHRCDDVAALIAEAERQARAGKWVVGMLAYEAAPAFDRALRVVQYNGLLPLAIFAVYAAPDAGPRPRSGEFSCGNWALDTAPARFEHAVADIRGAIGEGHYYQVNYSGRLRASFSGEAQVFFDALRASQPDAYCAFLDHGDWQLLSASPELFFDWSTDRVLTTRPMKGTAPRHADAAADADAAHGLRASAKERAENLMIVDLLRNDLSRVAETGTVRVPGLFEVEPLPTVWQMTSTISCTTRPEIGLVDVFRALFPCGSVTGAPKVAAMRAIVDCEATPRGAYCGAIGIIRPGGHACFNVGIRGVVIDAAKAMAECGVGSGITGDSSAAGEYAEWLVKRRFLLRASAAFELLETLPLDSGEFRLLDRHLARLQGSAGHFGFAFDAAAVGKALQRLAAEHPAGAWRVRLLVDRRGRVRSECVALEPSPERVMVALAGAPINSDDEFLRHKTTQRDVYAPHAPGAGVFDTLLYNERGEITEFTRGNVVIELDGRRVTPPESCGLLPGVLRGELLARGEIEERVITRAELARASRIWFVNNLRGMIAAELTRP